MITVKDSYLNKRTNKRVFFEETISEKEYNDRVLRQRKLMNALRFRDLEAKAQYAHEHSQGYCPHCYMLLPLSGKCDCGYSK